MNKQSSISVSRQTVLLVGALFIVMVGGLGYLTYAQYQMNTKLNATYSLINDTVDTRVTGGVATGNDVSSISNRLDTLQTNLNQVWDRVETLH